MNLRFETWHLSLWLPQASSPSFRLSNHCSSLISIEFVNAHVCFAKPAEITHYFYPVSYFERLVLKVFLCWLTVKNDRNSRALGEPSPNSSPPPLFSARVVAGTTHRLRSLLETDLMSAFTSSWRREFSSWKNSEIYLDRRVGYFCFRLWSPTESKCLRKANHMVHWGHFFPANSDPTVGTHGQLT